MKSGKRAKPRICDTVESRCAAKPLNNGARDGARTRDLRRDRPAL
jgi:hypothetical protein